MEEKVSENQGDYLDLIEPVQFGSKRYERLQIGRLKAAHMRTLRTDSTMGDMLNIAQKVCNVPRSVIDELCPEDANRLVDRVGNLLGGGS